MTETNTDETETPAKMDESSDDDLPQNSDSDTSAAATRTSECEESTALAAMDCEESTTSDSNSGFLDHLYTGRKKGDPHHAAMNVAISNLMDTVLKPRTTREDTKGRVTTYAQRSLEIRERCEKNLIEKLSVSRTFCSAVLCWVPQLAWFQRRLHIEN